MAEKNQSALSQAFRTVIICIYAVVLIIFFILSLTDTMHVMISLPVLFTVFGHAFIDWEKEKKNIAAILILIAGTVLLSFIAQVSAVQSDSKQNIYDFCLEKDSEEVPFVTCAKAHMTKLKNNSKFLIYHPNDSEMDYNKFKKQTFNL